MELVVACAMVWNILIQQKLSAVDHNQLQAAFYQAAPKCKVELEKAAKAEKEKAEKEKK